MAILCQICRIPKKANILQSAPTESAESLFQKELNRRGMSSSDTAEGKPIASPACPMLHEVDITLTALCTLAGADRQGSPSTSQRTSPAPQFAKDKESKDGQLQRSRQLNSEGLEVNHSLYCSASLNGRERSIIQCSLCMLSDLL